MTRRAQHSRGDLQHLCEHPKMDEATGINTRLLEAMSNHLSALLVRALPPTAKSGFPYFATMEGQCGGRISEFKLNEKRYEVIVREME